MLEESPRMLQNEMEKGLGATLVAAVELLPKNYPKTSLTLSGTLITHLRLGKISSCGISPKRVTVPSASSQSLFSTLLQVVDLISARAASHGDMTLH